MDNLLPPVFALVGVVCGAIAHHLLSRRADKRRSHEQLRSDSYVEFMQGASGVAIAQRFGNEEAEMKATTQMLEGKLRIGIYGDDTVAHAVGEFFEKYGDFSRDEDMRAFVELMHTMRSEVIPFLETNRAYLVSK